MTKEQFIERLQLNGFKFNKCNGRWERIEPFEFGIDVFVLFTSEDTCKTTIYHHVSDETSIDKQTIDDTAKEFEELYILME